NQVKRPVSKIALAQGVANWAIIQKGVQSVPTPNMKNCEQQGRGTGTMTPPTRMKYLTAPNPNSASIPASMLSFDALSGSSSHSASPEINAAPSMTAVAAGAAAIPP